MTRRHRNWGGRVADLRKARGNKCQYCGYSGYLEFAHIKKTKVHSVGNGRKRRGRGMVARYYDIKNNPESYRLLCRDCHDILDGRQEPVPF